MPVKFLAKKSLYGWLFTIVSHRGSFLVNIHAANGKLHSQQFSTEQEAFKYYSFICSKFSAFHSKPTKQQLSLFTNT